MFMADAPSGIFVPASLFTMVLTPAFYLTPGPVPSGRRGGPTPGSRPTRSLRLLKILPGPFQAGAGSSAWLRHPVRSVDHDAPAVGTGAVGGLGALRLGLRLRLGFLPGHRFPPGQLRSTAFGGLPDHPALFLDFIIRVFCRDARQAGSRCSARCSARRCPCPAPLLRHSGCLFWDDASFSWVRVLARSPAPGWLWRWVGVIPAGAGLSAVRGRGCSAFGPGHPFAYRVGF